MMPKVANDPVEWTWEMRLSMSFLKSSRWVRDPSSLLSLLFDLSSLLLEVDTLVSGIDLKFKGEVGIGGNPLYVVNNSHITRDFETKLRAPPRTFAPCTTRDTILLFDTSSYLKVCHLILSRNGSRSKSNIKTSRNFHLKRIKVKCLAVVLPLSELTIRRETAPRNQETANPSQKPPSTSNTIVPEAALIEKQTF